MFSMIFDSLQSLSKEELEFGAWSLFSFTLGVWHGAWSLALGVWRLEFDAWRRYRAWRRQVTHARAMYTLLAMF